MFIVSRVRTSLDKPSVSTKSDSGEEKDKGYLQEKILEAS